MFSQFELALETKVKQDVPFLVHIGGSWTCSFAHSASQDKDRCSIAAPNFRNWQKWSQFRTRARQLLAATLNPKCLVAYRFFTAESSLHQEIRVPCLLLRNMRSYMRKRSLKDPWSVISQNSTTRWKNEAPTVFDLLRGTRCPRSSLYSPQRIVELCGIRDHGSMGLLFLI